VAPRSGSQGQLYPYVDISHETNAIREANDLTRRERAELYENWYLLCPLGFLHLEKRIAGQWYPIAVSIILPLTPHGLDAITALEPARRLRVIDLDRSHILTDLAKRPPRVLLVDTWIVRARFRGNGHGKSAATGGCADALVLRHIARFWNSANRHPETKFLVESNNRALIPVLAALSFRPAGESKIGADFYIAEKSEMKGLVPHAFAELVAAIDALESVPMHVGSAPRL
jgi:hypothetical protein